MNTQQRIQQLIAEHPVVLFMKGTPQFPMCGFSGRAVQLLKMCGVRKMHAVDVLKDEAIRQGVKAFVREVRPLAICPRFPRCMSMQGSSAALILWRKWRSLVNCSSYSAICLKISINSTSFLAPSLFIALCFWALMVFMLRLVRCAICVTLMPCT